MLFRKIKIFLSLSSRIKKKVDTLSSDKCPFCDGTGMRKQTSLNGGENPMIVGHGRFAELNDWEYTRCYACDGSGHMKPIDNHKAPSS